MATLALPPAGSLQAARPVRPAGAARAGGWRQRSRRSREPLAGKRGAAAEETSVPARRPFPAVPGCRRGVPGGPCSRRGVSCPAFHRRFSRAPKREVHVGPRGLSGLNRLGPSWLGWLLVKSEKEFGGGTLTLTGSREWPGHRDISSLYWNMHFSNTFFLLHYF